MRLFYSHSHLKFALILRWMASPSSSAEWSLNPPKTCLLTTSTSTHRLSLWTCPSTNHAPLLHLPPRKLHRPPYRCPLTDPPFPHLPYRRRHPPPPPLHRWSPQPRRCSRQALWSPLEAGWEVSRICTSCSLCRRLRPAPWACREQGSWPAMFTASLLWCSRCRSCTPLRCDPPPALTTLSCYLCWKRPKARAKVRPCSQRELHIHKDFYSLGLPG